MSYLSHALMENRNGLVADAETTLATGTAEREAALTMAKRTFTFAAYNLTRMPTIFGWRLSAVWGEIRPVIAERHGDTRNAP